MRSLKFIRNTLSLLICLAFLLHASGRISLPLLSTLENQAYDFRLNLTMPGDTDPRIVIIDIDEKSLANEGRWPWGRDRLALLVDNLFEHYRVSIVGFDVLFAEKDESSGLKALEQLADGALRDNAAFKSALRAARPALERDRLFAASLKGRPVILGYYFKNEGSHGDITTTAGVLPPPVFDADQVAGLRIPFAKATGYAANLASLQQSAVGGGFIDTPLADGDGVIRRMLMLQQYRGALYPTFPLAIVQALLGSPPVDAFVAPGYENSTVNLGLEWLNVGGYQIPVDERAAALIPYRGHFPSFPYVSAVDVLDKTATAEVLEGAIALVGTTSAGLLDMRVTPVQNIYPGVEVHANMIAGIFDGTIKQKPGYTIGIDFVMLLLIGLGLTALLPRLSMMAMMTVSATTLAAVIGWNLVAWNYLNLDLPVVTQVALVAALFVLHVVYGFFVENRGKRKLARLFGQYVPPELVDEMSNSDADFALGGDTREMSVLFCDIRGFTAIAETLETSLLTQLINLYFTEMTRIIHEHRGTIDKYMGDAIMAFWGAPLRDHQHASHAVAAAMEMIRALPEIQRRCRERGWPEIRVGIGINSGGMHVGNMGSEFRMAYTVLGDAVNVASRLENLTKRYNVQLIVSDTTRAQAPDLVYRELDLVRVAGKDTAVRIFEPLGLAKDIGHEIQRDLALYHTALAYYRDREWLQAKELLERLLESDGAPVLYQMFYARVVHYLQNPPPQDWDGVFTLTSKS